MDEQRKMAIGLFNYAHSYAQSAVTLEKNRTQATHWDAPVRFLYFHAIELYLKSCLVVCGLDLEVLRTKHGHNVRPLADLAVRYGLELDDQARAIIALMDQTDNVITSRYIRIGTHTRLPFSTHYEACCALHEQIVGKVYEGIASGRPPILRDDLVKDK